MEIGLSLTSHRSVRDVVYPYDTVCAEQCRVEGTIVERRTRQTPSDDIVR